MSPRNYRMGKRAAAVEATRRRIIDAALREFAERGIEDTSMQAVARRADVAPGTVLNHFADVDVLAEASIGARMTELRLPTADEINNDDPLEERIAEVTRRLFAMYEATDLEYRIWTRSRSHPVMQRYEQRYNDSYTAAVITALGSEHADPRSFQVVSALIEPGFRANLAARGMSSQEAVEVAVELVVCWLRGGR